MPTPGLAPESPAVVGGRRPDVDDRLVRIGQLFAQVGRTEDGSPRAGCVVRRGHGSDPFRVMKSVAGQQKNPCTEQGRVGFGRDYMDRTLRDTTCPTRYRSDRYSA